MSECMADAQGVFYEPNCKCQRCDFVTTRIAREKPTIARLEAELAGWRELADKQSSDINGLCEKLTAERARRAEAEENIKLLGTELEQHTSRIAATIEERDAAEEKLKARLIAEKGVDEVTGKLIGDAHIECEAAKRRADALAKTCMVVAGIIGGIAQDIGSTGQSYRLGEMADRLRDAGEWES